MTGDQRGGGRVRWVLLAPALVLSVCAVLVGGCSDDGGDSVSPTTLAGSTTECAPGLDPDEPGPVDQARPPGSTSGGPFAAFDSQSARIVFVTEGQTWAFDVCTNSWQEMTPPPDPFVGFVVYDHGSDLIVALGGVGEPVQSYDVDSDSWARLSPSPGLDSSYDAGAVYDPASDRVITRGPEGLATFDVDTDSWDDLPVEEMPDGTLLAHRSTDQIVVWDTPMGVIQTRSGRFEPHDDVVNPELIYGFPPPPLIYTQDDAGMGIIHTLGGGELHGYDPTRPGWELLYGAGEFDTGPGSVGTRGYDAIVYDSLNERLVVIGGSVRPPGRDWRDVDDVWALDLDAGDWTELLPAS